MEEQKSQPTGPQTFIRLDIRTGTSSEWLAKYVYIVQHLGESRTDLVEKVYEMITKAEKTE